jgi:uncharacterized protein with PQ loop repeat
MSLHELVKTPGTGINDPEQIIATKFSVSPDLVDADRAHEDQDHEQIMKEKAAKTKHKKRIEIITTVIGYLATVISIAIYIPLVIEVYTNPEAACHINPWQYWLALLANVLWLVYAAALKAWPLLATSAAVIVMVVMVLIQKYITSACQPTATISPEPLAG